jgi:2-(1,2-epoxy-1,2-dihydrophenyl)acetyl-CoA isomerase
MADGAFGTIALEVDGQVGTVTLNRPDKMNALTIEMVGELAEALTMLSGSEAVRCIVLTGAGKAFCAGADLALLKDLHDRRDQEAGARIVDGCRKVYRIMRAAPQPVLCALNGVAAGGGANLALACDLRIAADSAKIGQVFARLGLHPDWGGTYFLPRLVGPARALELFLSAEMVDAPRLLALGLANKVVPAAQLGEATRAWAGQIAAAPPQAVRRAKAAVYQSERSTLDQMLTYELESQLACFATQDFSEGLAAFLGKREPHFTGR